MVSFRADACDARRSKTNTMADQAHGGDFASAWLTAGVSAYWNSRSRRPAQSPIVREREWRSPSSAVDGRHRAISRTSPALIGSLTACPERLLTPSRRVAYSLYP